MILMCYPLLGSHEIKWDVFWKGKIGKVSKEKQSVVAGKTLFIKVVDELFLSSSR